MNQDICSNVDRRDRRLISNHRGVEVSGPQQLPQTQTYIVIRLALPYIYTIYGLPYIYDVLDVFENQPYMLYMTVESIRQLVSLRIRHSSQY